MANPLRILKSQSLNPFFNLAIEETLLRNHKPSTQTLYMWRNAPNVMIGRTQNPYKECHLTNMEKDQIQLIRRQSGGGTVYQDLGNSLFAFIKDGSIDESKKINNQILLSALNKLGVNTAQTSGRNDIIVNGSKISGSAFRIDRNVLLHHGTMLLNMNFDHLKKYVTPNKLKMQSKGLKSVEARVINVSKILDRIVDHEDWCQALSNSFLNFNMIDPNSFSIEQIEEKNHIHRSDIKQIMEHRQSEAWRYGLVHEFKYVLEHKFDFGLIEVNIDAKHGHIELIKIYSDSLYPQLIQEIETSLTGIKYNQQSIQLALDKLSMNNLSTNVKIIKEFSDWLITQIN